MEECARTLLLIFLSFRHHHSCASPQTVICAAAAASIVALRHSGARGQSPRNTSQVSPNTIISAHHICILECRISWKKVSAEPVDSCAQKKDLGNKLSKIESGKGFMEFIPFQEQITLGTMLLSATSRTLHRSRRTVRHGHRSLFSAGWHLHPEGG
jgi:hypothetical protein